jgi:hypothetical protein
MLLYFQRMHTEKTEKCPYCPFMHVTESMVKYHIKKVHEKHRMNYNTVYCDQCPFKARFQSNLNAHIARKHHKDPLYWAKQRIKRAVSRGAKVDEEAILAAAAERKESSYDPNRVKPEPKIVSSVQSKNILKL